MKCSLGISNFLEEISSLSHSDVFLYFFALITWGRLSYVFLLFFGTLHSVGYIFPFFLSYLFLISSASVRSIPFLSFIVPIFGWNVPLVSLILLKRSLAFLILLFPSISFNWSLRKTFLSLLLGQENWMVNIQLSKNIPYKKGSRSK